MQEQMRLNAVDVLGGFIVKTMDEHKANTVSPFMKLFLEQQRALIGKGTGVMYHPMIIRFCLSLAATSAFAYDELRPSNMLTLPTRRTLRDYNNAVKPGAGFNHQVINELHLGLLVGYVDLGDPETNYASFKDPDSLATRVLVFYIRGLATRVLVFYIRGLATHVLVFYIRGLSTRVLVFYIRGLATRVLVFYIRGLATRVLVFYIRGLASDLNFELC